MHETYARALIGELLRCGVGRERAQRAAAELHDHYQDLEAEALAVGMSPEEASAEARERLGDLHTIASHYAMHPELRSRRPLLALGVPQLAGAASVGSDSVAIARWCVSACFGALLTSALLFVLQLVVL